MNSKLFLFLAILLIIPITAMAHPGRTNSEGCHTNKKTGEYHCHDKPSFKKARVIARTKSRQAENMNKPNCSVNLYNCKDFTSQTQAQKVFENCGGKTNDIHDLDRDNDGEVCESI